MKISNLKFLIYLKCQTGDEIREKINVEINRLEHSRGILGLTTIGRVSQVVKSCLLIRQNRHHHIGFYRALDLYRRQC